MRITHDYHLHMIVLEHKRATRMRKQNVFKKNMELIVWNIESYSELVSCISNNIFSVKYDGVLYYLLHKALSLNIKQNRNRV